MVLLHGIWLRALTLRRLARRIEAAGYDVATVDYPSVVGGPQPAVEALVRLVGRRAKRGARVHLVGHSLGGLVALEAIRTHPDLVTGRVVCLGTPLAGSRSARLLAGRRATRWMTGRSEEILVRGLAKCPSCAPVGMIAGARPFGLGRMFARLPDPNDGTVAVDETKLDGLADHCSVMTTHTGLLFSDEAARQAIAFLRDGRFEH